MLTRTDFEEIAELYPQLRERLETMSHEKACNAMCSKHVLESVATAARPLVQVASPYADHPSLARGWSL